MNGPVMVSSAVVIVAVVLSILLMLGVVPFTPQTVGAIILLVCIGIATPWYLRVSS